MKGSVLDALKDAYRRAPKHDPKHEPKASELLAFDPAFDTELLHAYRDQFSALEGAYDRLRRRSDEKAPLELLTKELAAFWKWIVAERDVLRLFQLLRWWRQDHFGPKKGETHASSAPEEVAYLLVAMRLLLIAVQIYEADVKGFTPEESAFIRAPLERAPHHSTYFRLLNQAYKDVPGVLPEIELFLRLHAFGEHMGGSLATNEELLRMLVGLLVSDPKELAQRSFTAGGGRPRQSIFKIGNTVDNRVYIVYFDARTPAPIYVNFAHTGGVVFAVPPAKIAALADQELVDLVYEGTKGMLVLIPLLFEVMVAVPGVVAGGLPALVEACLMPVEAKAAEKVMDALGLDGDKAGWVVLGINILLHRFRLGKTEVEVPEAGEGDWWWSRENGSRGLDEPGIDPEPTSVGSTPKAKSSGIDPDARANGGKSTRPLREDTDPKVIEEQRARPVKADEEPKAPAKAGEEHHGDASEAHKAGDRSNGGSQRFTDQARATGGGASGVSARPTPEVAPPRVRSARVRVEHELQAERLRVDEVKSGMSAQAWSKARAGTTVDLYNLLERRAILERMVRFPGRQYLEQVRVLGVRVSKKLIKATEGIAGKGRRVDVLELEGKQVTFHDLKTPSTLEKSVAGGRSQVDLEAEFRSESEIGAQHEVEQKVIAYARRAGGKIVVRGKDPVNGASIDMELDPGEIESTVSDYHDLGSN